MQPRYFHIPYVYYAYCLEVQWWNLQNFIVFTQFRLVVTFDSTPLITTRFYGPLATNINRIPLCIQNIKLSRMSIFKVYILALA